MTMYTVDNKDKIVAQKPSILNRMMVKLGSIFIIAISMVATASASIETDLANFSLIIGNSSSGLTGWTVSLLAVFMEPPLLYFVVIGIFITIISLVAGLLLRRKRR
jgi:hypothetical protein